MAWFSSLTREQRQRREALRNARQIARRDHCDPNPNLILQMADFILTGRLTDTAEDDDGSYGNDEPAQKIVEQPGERALLDLSIEKAGKRLFGPDDPSSDHG